MLLIESKFDICVESKVWVGISQKNCCVASELFFQR